MVPNPTKYRIYFNRLPKNCHIEIFNNLGQLQLSISNNDIDISSLANRFYIYAITHKLNNIKTTGKFEKKTTCQP